MVERAGTATALVAVHQASRSDAAVYDQWNKRWTVEFSRFFNFPKPITDVLGSGKRKPLRRFKTLSRGTWITASSQAVLQIGRPQADTDPVISVSLRERMLVSASTLGCLYPHFPVFSFWMKFSVNVSVHSRFSAVYSKCRLSLHQIFVCSTIATN